MTSGWLPCPVCKPRPVRVEEIATIYFCFEHQDERLNAQALIDSQKKMKSEVLGEYMPEGDNEMIALDNENVAKLVAAETAGYAMTCRREGFLLRFFTVPDGKLVAVGRISTDGT